MSSVRKQGLKKFTSGQESVQLKYSALHKHHKASENASSWCLKRSLFLPSICFLFCFFFVFYQQTYLPANSLSRYLAASLAPYTSPCSENTWFLSPVFSFSNCFIWQSMRASFMALFLYMLISFS